MKKYVIAATAVIALFSAAGCSQYGKAPIGKAPVVAKY